jgi:hypothetical protein
MKRNLVLFGMTALVAGAIACSSSHPANPNAPTATRSTSLADLPSDGSTLKVEPAAPLSPINDFKFNSPVVVLSARAATLQFPSTTPVVFQYRFQVMNTAGTVIENALVGGLTYTVTSTLAPNARHTWRVRPEVSGDVGPWSTTGSFISEDPAIINDTLLDGTTKGSRIGGRFIAGQGWQSQSLTDAIDYDIPGGCVECRLVFDATNFGGQEGFPYAKDLKWLSMGDWNSFGSFDAFRNSPWKMHLVQRADYPSGMEIIWRNGGTDADGGDPGDHRIKLTSTPITFSSSQVYHFQLDWDHFGYNINVNGIDIMDDQWDHWYETPNLRVELGCIPRAESFVGIIYRNVKLTKKR